MKLLSYNEFIYEDYRDVTGGSGGIHADDKLSNNMGIAGVGSNTTLDTIADPSGEKKVLGTEEIKIKDPYFTVRKKKEKKETDVEEEKKKRMRRKAYKYLHDIDKKALENIKKTFNIGDDWNGIGYRVDTGFWLEKGKTAKDVVDFESDELNNDDVKEGREKMKEMGVDLSKYPASHIIWVTKTKTESRRYGQWKDIEGYPIKNGIVVAYDGDGGYLVLMR